MKTLILVRHAQSDNKPSLDDTDRPLSALGAHGAVVLAGRFLELGLRVDALISSPAVRAYATAAAFAEKLSLPIQVDARIYEAGVENLQEIVRALAAQCSTVILVGHNPGLSEFLRYLTDENHADLPTASIAIVNLPVKAWRHTFSGQGVLKNSLCLERQNPGTRNEVPVLRRIDRFRFWRFQRAQRLEIIVVLVVVAAFLLILVPFLMHQSVDSSAMPQQGSSPR